MGELRIWSATNCRRTMGGPCWLLKEVPGQNRIGRFQGPPCTDNFQMAKFTYEGRGYCSCEQAFQAMKFEEGSLTRSSIQASGPVHNEDESSYGMRIWKM